MLVRSSNISKQSLKVAVENDEKKPPPTPPCFNESVDEHVESKWRKYTET